MRALICLVALACAGSAAAQDYSGLVQAREADRLAAEQAARQRDIALANELSRLQAQVQTNQALADLAALRAQPGVPVVRYDPKAPPPKIDLGKLAQIPDSILADSDAKVRAAADNRR
jgi:hypothetical protein